MDTRFDRDKGTEEDFAKTSFLVSEALRSDYPNIKAVRLYQLFNHVPLLSYGDKSYYEEKFFFTDSNILDIFSIPLVHGDSITALTDVSREESNVTGKGYLFEDCGSGEVDRGVAA